MPMVKAQAITQAGDHASIIYILLKDRQQTPEVVAALKSSQYEVKTFEEMNPLLVQLDQFSNVAMMALYLIVLAVVATVIVNTLIMAVFERTREIGILSAIGMKGSRIMAMFFAESSLLAVGGIAIGLLLGVPLVFIIGKVGIQIGDVGYTGIMFGDRLYTYLTLSDTITLSITALIVSLLAALYPALLAARMEPVEALHSAQ
jgi:ABC-type lipoprotein release transport system permease subunit